MKWYRLYKESDKTDIGQDYPDGFEVEAPGVLVKYTGTDKNVVIPNGISEIGEGAFEGASDLESVTFPSDLMYIDSNAFAGCRKLKKVKIPRGVEFEDDSFPRTCRILSGEPIKVDDFQKSYSVGGYMGIITGRGLDGKYCSGTIRFKLSEDGDFKWEAKFPQDSKPLGGYYEDHYTMISRDVEVLLAKAFYENIRKMVSRDQYMDWKTLFAKVKSMVEKFKEQREKDGFDTYEREWWYGKSDHGRD